MNRLVEQLLCVAPYAQKQPDPAALIQRSLDGIIVLLNKIDEKLDQLVKARSSED
jgi:hypothetical protein